MTRYTWGTSLLHRPVAAPGNHWICQFTGRVCAKMPDERMYAFDTRVQLRNAHNKTDELRIRLWQIPNSSVHGPRLKVFRVQSSQFRPLAISHVKPYFVSPLNQLPALCLFVRPAPDTLHLFSASDPDQHQSFAGPPTDAAGLGQLTCQATNTPTAFLHAPHAASRSST